MKNINIYAVALAMSFAACTNKEDLETPQQNSLNVITADIVQPATDSRIGIGALDQGKYPLTWQSADLITVVDSKGNRASYTYKGTTGAASGNFEKDPYYNYVKLDNIAYSIANIDAEALWVEPSDPDLKPIFDFNSGGTDASYSLRGGHIPMYGAWNDKTQSVQFYPLMGFLKVKVKVQNGYYLVIACDDEHCIGDSEATVQVDGTPESAKIVVSKWGNSEREIPSGSKGEFLIPLPAQQYKSFSLYMLNRTPIGNSLTEFRSKTITIKPKKEGEMINIEKKIYDLGELDFGTIDELVPVPGETIEWDRVDNWEDVEISKNK